MTLKRIVPASIFALLFTSSLVPTVATAGDDKPLTTTVQVRKSYGGTMKDGKMVAYVSANVTVQFHGGDAQKAYALGNVTAEPAVIDGKKRTPEPKKIKGFKFIVRSEVLTPHPDDGLGVSISYGEIDKKSQSIDVVKGTVDVLVGGVEKEVIVDKLDSRMAGAVESPIFKKSGLNINFERTSHRGDKTAVSITMSEQDKNSIAGIQCIGADGKPVEDSPMYGWSDDTYMQMYWLTKDELKTAHFKVLVREGWQKKTLPFEIKDVPIK